MTTPNSRFAWGQGRFLPLCLFHLQHIKATSTPCPAYFSHCILRLQGQFTCKDAPGDPINPPATTSNFHLGEELLLDLVLQVRLALGNQVGGNTGLY